MASKPVHGFGDAVVLHAKLDDQAQFPTCRTQKQTIEDFPMYQSTHETHVLWRLDESDKPRHGIEKRGFDPAERQGRIRQDGIRRLNIDVRHDLARQIEIEIDP
jgi:hypothetical protein